MSINLSRLGFLRIASVSPDLKVGDIAYNTEIIIGYIEAAKLKKCDLVLFPELSLTGYTAADLFFQDALMEEVLQAIDLLMNYTGKTESTVIVGAPLYSDGMLFNCAVVISYGNIAGIIPKTYIPNYNEYYEKRWFSSENNRVSDSFDFFGEQIPFGADIVFDVFNLGNIKFGVEICEDLWAVVPPSSNLAKAGANIIFNLSASNEILGKMQYRRQLVMSQSASSLAAYVYSSSGTGESTTDLVFSGHCMIAENGKMLAESDRFLMDGSIIYADVDTNLLNNERKRNSSFAAYQTEKIYRVVDIHIPELEDKKTIRSYHRNPFIPDKSKDRAEVCSEIFSIQASGLAKRMKHIGTGQVVLGISGGLDSTLALMVAVRTFNRLGLDLKGINAVSMPGFGTSARTKNNAENLAVNLGITFRKISINKSVLQHFDDIGHDPEEHNLTYENAQARERTQILMDLANQVGGIVIGTGDLSELALGWATYNGDHMSMYGVNSGIPKTLVRYIVEWCAGEYKDRPVISDALKDICNTPISPELLPADKKGNISQKTEESVGPFDLNDFFLYYSVRYAFSPKKILFLADTVFRKEFGIEDIKSHLKNFYKRFFANQFKRSCLPDGIKVGTVALSPRGDLRMPSDASPGLWLKEIDDYPENIN